jgi:hypothetical protein
VAEAAAEVIRATTGWGGPTDPNPVANEAGPYDISPDDAADVLADLPQTQLAAHRPLPMLDGPGLRVERDDSGLITNVEYDGQWMDVRQFLDQLTADRAQAWRDDAENPELPDIRRADVGPCISIALDRRTGLLAEGHNELELEPGELHPLLGERLDRYEAVCAARSEQFAWGSRLHPSEPGTHSELYAVSELLWSREAAGLRVDASTLRELLIDNEFPWKRNNPSAPCCGNCTAVIPDVPSDAGKLPYFQAPREEKWPE